MYLTLPNSFVVRHKADAMIFVDLRGVIRGWNLGAETIFGFTRIEAVGKSLDLITPKCLHSLLWEEFRRTINKARPLSGRRAMFIRSLNSAGKSIYVDIRFVVVTATRGNILGVVTLVNDATLNYQNERALCERLLLL